VAVRLVVDGDRFALLVVFALEAGDLDQLFVALGLLEIAVDHVAVVVFFDNEHKRAKVFHSVWTLEILVSWTVLISVARFAPVFSTLVVIRLRRADARCDSDGDSCCTDSAEDCSP